MTYAHNAVNSSNTLHWENYKTRLDAQMTLAFLLLLKVLDELSFDCFDESGTL